MKIDSSSNWRNFHIRDNSQDLRHVVHTSGSFRTSLMAMIRTPFHALSLKPPPIEDDAPRGYAAVSYSDDCLFDQHRKECGPCNIAGLRYGLTGEILSPREIAKLIPRTFHSGDTHPYALEIGAQRVGIEKKAFNIDKLNGDEKRRFFHTTFKMGQPIIALTRLRMGSVDIGRHYDLGLSFDPDSDTISTYNSLYGSRKRNMKGSNADKPGNNIVPMEEFLERCRAARVLHYLLRGYVMTGTMIKKERP